MEVELGRERAKEAPGDLPTSREGWAALKKKASEARKAERAAARVAKAAQAPAPERPVSIEVLSEELDKAKAELVKRNTRIRNLEQKVRALTATMDQKRTRLIMSKRLHREIRSHLHPDRVPPA